MISVTSLNIGLSSPRPQRRLRRSFVLSVALLVSLTGPLVAFAQETQRDTAPSSQRKPGGTRWEGSTLHIGNSVKLDPKARVQADFLLREESTTPEDRFSWGSRRIGLDGELFNRVQFQVEHAFQDDDDDDTPWRDVYVDVRVNRALQVRGGRFKLPYSLERTTSRDELDFLQRATAVRALAPARDTGVMLHGRVRDRVLGYEVGVFKHADGFDITNDDNVWGSLGATLAGRVTFTPIQGQNDKPTRDLELGASFVRNSMPEGLHSRRGRTFADDPFFERMWISGQRTRLGAEGLWNGGRVTVKGELLQMSDQRLGQAVTGDDLSDLILRGGYITGVVRVMGEHGKKGPAVDVAARVDRLSLGSGNQSDEAFTNPRADHVAPFAKSTWTFGATWLVHRWIRVQANAIREQLVDDLGVRNLNTTATWTTVMRLQFAL